VLILMDGTVVAYGAARPAVIAVSALLITVFAAGAVAAFVSPSRGVHDRIVGTRVVPR
jgi:hypothetical protein